MRPHSPDCCPACGQRKPVASRPARDYAPAPDTGSGLFEKNRLYSITEAAGIIGVSRWAVRRWIYSGQLSAMKANGKKVVIRGSDLELMLDPAYRRNDESHPED